MGDRGIALAIDGVAGFWPDPPQLFSFSSLNSAEACPRRYGLTRASYPDLWSESGYPGQPNVAAMVGDVIHDSLETIIAALVDGDCESTHDSGAVEVLRQLGGYSAVIRRALDERVERLQSNPRCCDRTDRLRRELTLRISEMRQTTQALLSRSRFTSGQRRPDARSAAEGTLSKPAPRRSLNNGSYPEMNLVSSDLRLAGRADLVTIEEGTVHIVDYKTGSPSDEHSDQLRMYALIWANRDDFEVDRPVATNLTLSYPNYDHEIEAPTGIELELLEAATTSRIAELTSQLEQSPPEARPSEDTCKFCSVRHLCDPYWRSLPPEAPADGFGDLRGEVMEENGPRSWNLRLSTGQRIILRVADEATQYEPGSWLRVLGAVLSPATDETPHIASLVATSEVFTETRTPTP